MKQSILVADILSVFSFIPILTRFRSSRKIFYLHKTNDILTIFAFKVLSKCGWSFEQLRYTLSPVNGVSPYKEFQKILMERIKVCKEKIFSKQIDALCGISEYERLRLSACFGKYAGAEMYFAIQLFVILSTKFVFKDKIKVVLLKKSIFSDLVSSTYHSGKLIPYFYMYFGRERLFFRENYVVDKIIFDTTRLGNGGLGKLLIKTIFFVCCSLIRRLLSLFSTSSKLIKKHKICALLFNRHGTELSNCIPWGTTESSYLKDETLSLHLRDMPKAAWDFYRTRSDRFIEYSYAPFINNKNKEIRETWSHFNDFFLNNIWKYRNFFGFKVINRWMSKYLLEILTYLSFFEALFWVNGAKVLWTMNEDDFPVQMAAMAINRLGGVSLGTTWSQAPLPTWDIQHNQHDIYFVWGKRLADIRKDTYDQCYFLIVAGYPADEMFVSEFKKAQDFRASIFTQHKANNILVFFDNISANDIFLSPETIFEIYREMFIWLEEDPTNFFIIKAKRKETLNKYPALKEKIDEFCKKGRILILYDRAAIYPGLVADVVISTSLTLPSLAVMLGRPFVYYDIHGVARDYPLGLSSVRIISEAREIRQAVNNAMEESHRMGYPEKLRPIRNSFIDPFVDGKAKERIREYITNLLRKFDSGLSSREAINFASEEYKKRWGADTVVTGPLILK